MEEDGRKLGSKWVTDSEVVSSVPCDLLQVVATQTSAPGAFKVYDGVDTNGELKLDLRIAYSQNFTFPGGMYMRKGIYYLYDTKIQGVLFRWRVHPRKED